MAPTGTLGVDPQTYYDSAKALNKVLDGTSAAFSPLNWALRDNGGMAGNYQGVQTWTGQYDGQTGIRATVRDVRQRGPELL